MKTKIHQKQEVRSFSGISREGSALIVALVTLTLLTVMSTVFFEKIYRFAQASNGIENSNAAYYKALGIIEESLYTGGVNKYTPWNARNVTLEGTKSETGRSLSVSTGGNIVPMPGKGNSPYDTDYNIIGLGQPVQLVIPNGILDWSTIYFEFRVPTIAGNTNTGLTTPTNSGVILWTLASSGASLFASGETNTFQASTINMTNSSIDNYRGTSNSGDTVRFGTFYLGSPTPYIGTTGANCAGFQCTLKLSMIRPVITTDGRTITFLEYKISGFPSAIPSQYMNLHAEGYSYGFLRARDLKFPQITTNTALDFAVLQ